MTAPARIVAASGSVAIVAGVVVVAAALGPDDSRAWLLFCGLLATAAALQGVLSDPRDLAPALLLSLPPVVALASDGSPTWLIGPLATALLVAGELIALSWESRGTGPTSSLGPRRLLEIGQLAALALAAALAVRVIPPVPVLGGAAAVAVAAAAIAALGILVFRRTA